jgi:hypothetical protein
MGPFRSLRHKSRVDLVIFDARLETIGVDGRAVRLRKFGEGIIGEGLTWFSPLRGHSQADDCHHSQGTNPSTRPAMHNVQYIRPLFTG